MINKNINYKIVNYKKITINDVMPNINGFYTGNISSFNSDNFTLNSNDNNYFAMISLNNNTAFGIMFLSVVDTNNNNVNIVASFITSDVSVNSISITGSPTSAGQGVCAASCPSGSMLANASCYSTGVCNSCCNVINACTSNQCNANNVNPSNLININGNCYDLNNNSCSNPTQICQCSPNTTCGVSGQQATFSASIVYNGFSSNIAPISGNANITSTEFIFFPITSDYLSTTISFDSKIVRNYPITIELFDNCTLISSFNLPMNKIKRQKTLYYLYDTLYKLRILITNSVISDYDSTILKLVNVVPIPPGIVIPKFYEFQSNGVINVSKFLDIKYESYNSPVTLQFS
ncbi:MAG: hypothetical protein QW478_01365 [Candidatus Micrarchaeaceae archaeon]